MDKKKTAGVIIFFLLIGAYIGYPKLNLYNHEKNIKALFNSGQYEAVHYQLRNADLEVYNFEYMYLVKTEIQLGLFSEAGVKINRLIDANKVELLQELVDELGTGLGSLLLTIDKSVDEIEYTEKVREELIKLYAFEGSTDKAMELRGDKKEIDLTYLIHLENKGDIEEFLAYYSDIPVELLDSYYKILVNMLLLHPISESSGSEELIEHFHNIAGLQLPNEAQHVFGKSAASIYNSHYNESIKYIFEHEIFTENIYFDYYNKIYSLIDSDNPQVDIGDIKENKEFDDFPLRDRLIDIVDNYTKVESFEYVTNGGVLWYYQEQGGNKYFDLFSEEEGNLPVGIQKYSISFNRSYIHLEQLHTKRRTLIYDNKFNLVKEMEPRQFLQWIDDESFIYTESGSDFKKHNLNTGVTEIYFDDIVDIKFGIRELSTFRQIWSAGEEVYTTIQQLWNMDSYADYIESPYINSENRNSFYYAIRNIEDDSSIYGVEYNFSILGSCEEYIYGAESVEDIFYVLVAVNKETLEKTNFPFYAQTRATPFYLDRGF
ncbi:hypothetical protein HYG86_15320 [Alkalicella caledoniensis]|uniref:Uncharacterized protein n=1 Tax=Alkalicella caledoniensis TaxID=2731377 RepID=A0A7G9WBH7_ALKCA|nr:hypothetical protein [Alkalicella caledoniensis]QNO16039.1 hypothetical protein HYG86_15320 [Alkalicella caledoniensis]